MGDMNTKTAVLSRPRLERALWEFTDWKGDQSAIDGLLVVIDTYVLSQAQALLDAPLHLAEGQVHTLVTLAEQIIDTGGKLSAPRPKVVPQKAATHKPAQVSTRPAWPVCRTCGVRKESGDYYRDSKNRATGYKTQCKQCETEQKSAAA
jgi:hypothetical protein